MNPIFKKDAVILFTGDSITDSGRSREDPLDLGPGYPAKAAAIYRSLFAEQNITFYNRGVRGDTSKDLLARYDTDLFALNPDFISILIGGNDSWHKFDEVDYYTPPEEFMNTCRTLLTKIKSDFPQAKIMLLEPYEMFQDELAKDFREDLNPKITCLRQLAKEYADYYLPLDGLLQARAATVSAPLKLTLDGIHPTDEGHAYIAYCWLKALKIL